VRIRNLFIYFVAMDQTTSSPSSSLSVSSHPITSRDDVISREVREVAEVPIIDIGPLVKTVTATASGATESNGSGSIGPSKVEDDVARVVEELRRACLDIGFFYITNHGIDPDLVRKLFQYEN
jgi:hypothetical protein